MRITAKYGGIKGLRDMPKGKCKKCGAISWGWAVENVTCDVEISPTEVCGGEIELVEPDKVED